MTESAPLTETTYKDDDFVYVDPEKQVVVGMVEWTKTGNAKPLEMPNKFAAADDEEEKEKPKDDKRPRRVPRKRFYPWGSYKSMKKIYKLEGKPVKTEPNKTLDEVIDIAMEQPFWN